MTASAFVGLFLFALAALGALFIHIGSHILRRPK